MNNTRPVRPHFIFECSWEVCNKVGGIYTVLSTRAHTMQSLFPDKVLFIGPDFPAHPSPADFIEDKTLLADWRKQTLVQQNLPLRIGRWKVPGEPIVALVDYQSLFEKKNSLYQQMWEQFGVDSLHAYGDYDESCVFAYACALVMESYYHYHRLEKQEVVAHFNEWMLGMGSLYLRKAVPAIATLFTTHATSIGRSISGNGKALYAYLEQYNGDQMAQELNMQAKHSVEKQAAHYADCFTTVSDITAIECKQLLDKQPDIVTPNGFEDNFVPRSRSFTAKRNKARKKLLRLVNALTGNTPREDALLIASSGRYEYKNKGLDVFVAAINELKQAKIGRDIVAFILVPAWIKDLRADVQERMQQGGFYTDSLPNNHLTHQLFEPDADPIGKYLTYLGFSNEKRQKVQLVFVPSYLTGSDGIINLSYYDTLIGMDLTVFPSYYEPWGYTPLESIAFGIPSLTTNLAGFGLWALQQKNINNQLEQGVEVVNRTDYNYFEAVQQIAQGIARYASLNKEAVKQSRKAATDLAQQASWQHFINYYLEAYSIALKASKKRNK